MRQGGTVARTSTSTAIFIAVSVGRNVKGTREAAYETMVNAFRGDHCLLHVKYHTTLRAYPQCLGGHPLLCSHTCPLTVGSFRHHTFYLMSTSSNQRANPLPYKCTARCNWATKN